MAHRIYPKDMRKIDLINLLKELGESADESETILHLKMKIESSDIFKTDVETVSNLLVTIVEDRKTISLRDSQSLELERLKLSQLEKTNNQNLEIERIKLEREQMKFSQLEKQLEITKLADEKANSNDSSNSDSVRNQNINSLENLIKNVKALTIPVPEKAENFNLFFQTLERAFSIKKVPDTFKSEILINILGEKLNHILHYLAEDEIRSYETLKKLVLKEYQPTAQECLIKFRKAFRELNETHVQFASRLNALFLYYLELRNVNDFKSLCELIVSDKLFQTLDKETAEYVSIKQGEGWLNPKTLARECDVYFVQKGKSFDNVYRDRRDKVDKNDQGSISDTSRSVPWSDKLSRNSKSKHISCYLCSGQHYVKYCPKRFPKPEDKMETSRTNVEINCIPHIKKIAGEEGIEDELMSNELEYVTVWVDGAPIKALIDSGAGQVVLSTRVVPRGKVTNEKITLSSCFREKRVANLAKFNIAVENREPMEMVAAVCEDLSCDMILPSNAYDVLRRAGAIAKQVKTCSSPISDAESKKTVAGSNANYFRPGVGENISVLNKLLANVTSIEDSVRDLRAKLNKEMLQLDAESRYPVMTVTTSRDVTEKTNKIVGVQEKIKEDKTCELKNNKGAKSQKFVQHRVKTGNQVARKDEFAKSGDKKKEVYEINAVFRPVAVQRVGKVANPEPVLCYFYKQGRCTRGDKCKFAHDMSMKRRSEKSDVYALRRDKEESKENWNEEKLREVERQRLPVELLSGVKMRNRKEKWSYEMSEKERMKLMSDKLKTGRRETSNSVLKIKEENRECDNRKRKKAHFYKRNDSVIIQRTQFGTGMKLLSGFYGPYEISQVKPDYGFQVKKVGDQAGPNSTSSSADHMKLWCEH